MGKIKRERKKFHAPASNRCIKEAAETRESNTDGMAMDTGLLQAVQPNIVFPTKGLFDGASLDPSVRLQPPTGLGNDDDRMSFVSKKSVKGSKQLKKLEKRKLRHERWMEKMDVISTTKRREKDAKKRSEVPVIGDMNPLHDALPELSEILRIGQQYGQKKTAGDNCKKKPRATLKMKDRQKLVMEETAHFQEVLKHSAFKSNPFATINEHLKNKLKQEQESDQT